MSNRTLANLRTAVRDYINEPVAANSGFTNVRINRSIARAYNFYYRLAVAKKSDLAKRDEDITYTASAESYAITTSGYDIEDIEMVQDRTSVTPGVELQRASSKAEIIRHQSGAIQTDSIETGCPSHWFFEKTESIASGVVTVAQKIYLAPVPGTARSLRLHVHGGPQDITGGDTYTTGMPDYVDDCIEIKAALLLRAQEGASGTDVAGLKSELGEFELELKKRLRSYTRGPTPFIYHGD